MSKISILICAVFFALQLNAQVQRKSLTENWSFKHADSTQWHKAVVPGCVHADLFKNKLISDPFFGANEEVLQWVEDQPWVYERKFDVEAKQLSKEKIELVFEGLDTYAEVYLNGRLIHVNNNMFVSSVLDVKPYLKETNALRIEFLPPLDEVKKQNNNIAYPGGEQVHVRKAPFMFGWDWGPRFATVGIWKEVYLISYNQNRIEDVFVKQNMLIPAFAKMEALVEVGEIKKEGYSLEVLSEQGVVKAEVVLAKGTSGVVSIPFTIANPKFWWPNGMGVANLYRSQVVLKKDGQPCHSEEVIFGLRKIELVNEQDSLGSSFYFKVNGIPLFVKGANYIPQNIFLNEVKTEDYERLIMEVKNSNMNMLRVWGGGIYEKDLFYELCDKNGILVWQDFMFACTMYPGDQSFMESVAMEASQQVKRLRNHPCIALWCGNNEVSEGWNNWGWQRQMKYTAEDSAKVWSDYQTLFQQLLPQIVSEQSAQTPYWESSPEYGRGDPMSFSNGDFHYWGVWHDAEPFENFNVKTGRFMSEYGFQAYPDIKTIAAFADSADWQPDSKVMLTHQKHGRGNKLIKQYMKDNYGKVPENFEEFVYYSQLTQSYGMEIGIKAQRRSMPYCMGTLYWQLNDCWPVVSWSSIDYYGRWKPMHYMVRKNYEPVLISGVKNNGDLKLHIISDLPNDTTCLLEVNVVDFKGDVLYSDRGNILLKGNKSDVYRLIQVNAFDSTSCYVSVRLLTKNNGVLQQEVVYLTKPKNLVLPKKNIPHRLEITGDKAKITVSAQELMKNVWIDFPDVEHSNLSENNFDLLPGETKVLECSFKTDLKEKPLIRIRVLNPDLNQEVDE